jgi:hypothetical protein
VVGERIVAVGEGIDGVTKRKQLVEKRRKTSSKSSSE